MENCIQLDKNKNNCAANAKKSHFQMFEYNHTHLQLNGMEWNECDFWLF